MFRNFYDMGLAFAERLHAEPKIIVRPTPKQQPLRHAKIVATAFHTPPTVETSAELASKIGRGEDWILSRTGIRERRIADEPVEVLAARAARAALAAGSAPDLIVNASTTARQLIPDTSVFIQDQLGLEGIPSFSIHATCLSFMVALNTSVSLVASGAYRRVLVVSAELGSRARNMREPESAALLGDGAAAAVVEATPENEASALLGWRMTTWPKGAELSELPGGGMRCHPNDPATRPENNLFTMNGPRLFKMARQPVLTLVRELLDQCGLRLEDVNLVVPHQASGPALDALPRWLGVEKERVVNIIADYGNCIAASVPMALAHADSTGRLRRGDRVLLLGTGAGLSIAGALLRW